MDYINALAEEYNLVVIYCRCQSLQKEKYWNFNGFWLL